MIKTGLYRFFFIPALLGAALTCNAAPDAVSAETTAGGTADGGAPGENSSVGTDYFSPTVTRDFGEPSMTYSAFEYGGDPDSSRRVENTTGIARYRKKRQVKNGKNIDIVEFYFTNDSVDTAPEKHYGLRLIIFDFRGPGVYQLKHTPETFAADRPGEIKMTDSGVPYQDIRRGMGTELIRDHFAAYQPGIHIAYSTGDYVQSDKELPYVGGAVVIEGIDPQGRVKGAARFTGVTQRCTGSFGDTVCKLLHADVDARFVVAEHVKPEKTTVKPKARKPLKAMDRFRNVDHTKTFGKPRINDPRHAECPAPTGPACRQANESYQKYTECFRREKDSRCRSLYRRHAQNAESCEQQFKISGC